MADSKSKHQVEISAVDKVSSVVSKIESKFKRLGSIINSSLAIVGVGGVTALSGALVKGIKLASEEEQVMKRLATSIQKTGINYSLVKGDVESLLKSQQMLTQFADDESAGALATLAQLTGNLALSMKALKVTEDLASTGLFDLDSASKAVGKALTGNTMLLQRMGIQIKAGDDVLAKLEQRFGGSAAQNVNTFSGAMTQLKNTVSDAFESLGGPLLEPLKTIALRLRDSIASPEIQGRIKDFAQSIADGIPRAVDKLLAFSSWVVNNGDTILTFFKGLIALRIVTWATSAAMSLYALAPAISTAIAAAISPVGLVVLAAASGLTIGTVIGKKIAEGIRNSRGELQQAIPWISKEAEASYNMEKGKFPLVGSGLNAKNLGMGIVDAGEEVVTALYKVARAISASDAKVLGRRFFGAAGVRDSRDPYGESEGPLGSMFPQARGVRNIRSPYGDTQADRMLSQDFRDTPMGASIGQLEEHILMIAPVFQQMMSAVTNTIVQGLMTGKGQIVDVLNALKGAILSILSQIAAKMAVVGLLSLIPGVGSFKSVFDLLGGSLFGAGGGNRRIVPIGASPNAGTFGGGRPVIVNIGTVYGADADILTAQIEQKLAYRMRSGTSKMLYSAVR